jgi:hypothetical protein
MAVAPVEYFRCRRERGQIGPVVAWTVEAVIRLLMTVNGRLATRAIALGPYLQEIARQYSSHTEHGAYYGVDMGFFTPATEVERTALRAVHDLPADAFVIFFSSRMSHEKDPETVLRATALARGGGVFSATSIARLVAATRISLALAGSLGLPDVSEWARAARRTSDDRGRRLLSGG